MTPTLPKMKPSTKLFLSGIVTVLTVVVAGFAFDALGVIYGPSSAGLSALAGMIGSLRLFDGV